MKNLISARPSRRTLLRLAVVLATAVGLAGAPDRVRAQTGTANAAPAKIGVIGSGHIGSTLAALWVKAGHSVMLSSRHPEELKDLVEKLGPLARAGTVADAAGFGDVVFLAVPYRAYPELGQQVGAALRGKVVLDAGNAVPARDGDIASEARENGIGVTSAKYFPGARIVRAFNTLGYRVLESQANRGGPRMAIPLAGDDPDALATAQTLVRDAGFDPVVVGPLARATEFAQGGPLYGQQITADEMRQRFPSAQ